MSLPSEPPEGRWKKKNPKCDTDTHTHGAKRSREKRPASVFFANRQVRRGAERARDGVVPAGRPRVRQGARLSAVAGSRWRHHAGAGQDALPRLLLRHLRSVSCFRSGRRLCWLVQLKDSEPLARVERVTIEHFNQATDPLRTKVSDIFRADRVVISKLSHLTRYLANSCHFQLCVSLAWK